MDLNYVQDSEEDSTPTRRRRTSRTTERIVWSGSPVYTEDENKFYHAVKIDSIAYYLKDYVQLPQSIVEEILKNINTSQNTKRLTRSKAKGSKVDVPANCVIIGNIKRLWEDDSNKKMCQLVDFWVSPDATPGGRRPHHGAKELVQLDQLDELDRPLNDMFPKTHSTTLKRVVESFEEFAQRKDFPDNVYFVHREKLLEPKIEAASPMKKRKEKSKDSDDNLSNKTTSSLPRNHLAEDPATSYLFDDVNEHLPTPSPSKRKNMRMISDDSDYVVLKQEGSLEDESGDTPRRFKRMRKVDDVEGSPTVEPEEDQQISTPKRRRRIITDSDDEELFANEPDPEPTRRSSRIPVLQQQKHDKVRKLVSRRISVDEEDGGDNGSSSDNHVTSDSDDKSGHESITGQPHDLPDDSEIADLSTSKVPSPVDNKSPVMEKHKSGSKRDMSWIEMSEKGKLAAPGAKHSLLFDQSSKPTPAIPPRIKSAKPSKQSNIKAFMSEKSSNFVNLVDEDDEITTGTNSSTNKSKKDTKRSESGRNKKPKEKETRSAAFIPQLMFDDNDVDNDIKKHLKQQMLQHDLARYSSANDDSRETNNRWGRTKRRVASPTDMDDESDNGDNNSEYESDDFMVADDAPIETYEPSQDELDDGLEESDKEKDEDEDGDEFEDDINESRNDQDGLFNHVFTNKQAFIVFLQYMISACADDDFIPMMVDEENQDTYFRPALRKIRDQIASRKASLVQSSAWDENFKEELEIRPYYASWETQNPALEDCHACLRANHPASYKLCLSGPCYNPEKYMTGNNVLDIPVLPSRDSEEYEEAEEVNYLLGRFCHTRTSLYHRLHFFHVHMFARVQKKVEKEPGTSTTEELVQSLLDNSSWITEMSDIYSNLLLEADDFMNDSHEIM